MFSLSLICGNVAYLYLSVSFIQMLKATNAVVTLFATWAFGIAPPNMKVLGNVGIIVLGVVIASFGEIKFDLVGFVCMYFQRRNRDLFRTDPAKQTSAPVSSSRLCVSS